MKLFAQVLLAVSGVLVSAALLAGDLAGYWQHEEQPAWIEIRFEDGTGTGTVVRNDKYPDRVGRLLLKDVVPYGDDAGNWRAQVYAEKFEEYKDAEVSLPETDHMKIKVKVGFMSRTINWTRVAALPGE